MIPLEQIKEFIFYAIDNGLDRPGVSVTVNIYESNVEISVYHINETPKEG